MNPQAQQEIIKWYDIITRQNYFTHNNDIITQYDGLAMGAPSSGIIAEMFLQHTEQRCLPHITRKHKIANLIHPNLHFTAEMETTNPSHIP